MVDSKPHSVRVYNVVSKEKAKKGYIFLVSRRLGQRSLQLYIFLHFLNKTLNNAKIFKR